MAVPTERMVSLRDGKFRVQLLEGGSGESLLYLHGMGGFPGWPPFLDRLAEMGVEFSRDLFSPVRG